MKANQINEFNDPNIQTEIENIYNILNKVGFGTTFDERSENMDSFLVAATSNSTAGDDTQLTHDLKRVPIGYLVLNQSGSGDFYAGSGTNTETSFFIKCTTGGTAFKVAIL